MSATTEKNGVTKVTLERGGEAIAHPSVEQLEQAIQLLKKKIQDEQLQIRKVLGNKEEGAVVVSKDTSSDKGITSNVGEKSVASSFEEPETAALDVALKDIESRVGLSDDEYAEKYNLRNINVDFVEFEERLRSAPVEKRVRIIEAHQRENNLVLFCQKDSGEFGLMNPRNINTVLLGKLFNEYASQYHGLDSADNHVSILRAEGRRPVTRNESNEYITPCDDLQEANWYLVAPEDNMTDEQLDNTRVVAVFNREVGAMNVFGNNVLSHSPNLGGVGVLWV